MKLAGRLTLMFVLLAVVPVLITGALAFYTGRQSAERAEINHLVSANIMKSAELTRWIVSNQRRVEELAQRPLLVWQAFILTDNASSPTAYNQARNSLVADHLQPRVSPYSGLLEVSVIGASGGAVLASSDYAQEGKYYANHRFFSEGKVRTYTQGVFYSLPLQQSAMYVSTPVIGPNGSAIGVLAARLDMRDLSQIMSARSGLSRSEKTYLVNRTNFFVTEPRYGEGYALKKTVRTEGVLAGLAGSDGVDFYNDYRGVPVIGAYKWLPEYNMVIVTEVDQDEAYAPINAMTVTFLTIVLVLILAVLATGYYLARSITQPLARLVSGAAAIGRGHLDQKVGTDSPDEVGELSRAFDRMAAELKETTVTLDEAERRIRERTAELEDANRELEAFSYSVSHDLRAPLRAIDGYTGILLDDYSDVLGDEGRRVCGVISGSAHRMSRLIDDLLAFSRLGRAAMKPTRVDMQAMAGAVYQELADEKLRKRISFRLEDLPAVTGDSSLLRQVWVNLISNAVKFSSRKRHPIITASAEEGGGEVVYCVRDNGVGFDPQYAGKLFGVFQRLHSVKDFEGNGVGLALVQRILHRHGGRVWAESEPGKGAAFYFSLPREGGSHGIDA